MTVCKFGNIKIEVDLIIGDDGREALHFRHPLSGKWCQSINTVLKDMEEYYERKKKEWAGLAGYINNDKALKDAIVDNVNEKEYF